jgi:hypothetical protein
MTAEITTIVGQFSIKGGSWRSQIPNQVAVREPKSADVPGAGKGDLFIVTEIQGQVDDRDALEQRLAHLIRDGYYLARGSVTASLRRAVQAGNDLLYNRNRKAAVEERVAGGVAIVVIYQEDAFIAQIGPAACFAVLGDHIQRYPARSVWLDETGGPARDEDASALGLNRVVEPNLQHFRVSLQDIVVLADSRLAGQLPLSDLARAVRGGDVKAAAKNLGKAAKAKDCSALVLEIVETSPNPLNPAKLGGLLARRRSQPANGTTVAASSRPEATAELQPELESEVKTTAKSAHVFASTSIMERPQQWFGTSKSKPKTDLPEDEPEVSSTGSTAVRTQERHELRQERSRPTEVVRQVASKEAVFEEELPVARSSRGSSFAGKFWRRLGARPLVLAAVLGNAFKAIFSIFPGSNRHETRQAGRQAQQPSSGVPWKLLRNIAIAIPLLVALVVTVSYLQKGRLREAEYAQFIEAAKSKFEQAKVVDVAAALALMTEAETVLVQAEEIKEEPQPEIAELRQQMAEEADRAGKVQRLYYLPQVRQYTDPGTAMQGIIVQGVEIYVLDTGNDRIFHHQLDDSGEALLPDDEAVLVASKGQTVENIAVGELLGMTWMPTGGNRQTSDLVILNSTGLLEYNPSWGITISALAGPELLRLPTAVSSYFGNFYILDPQANVFFRYLPTADGYNAQPENYFPADQPVDLTNAVDVAIDGEVYILYKDGRINKFLTGQPSNFSLTGLDKPLNRPVAIFTAPDETIHHVYIADAGNQRIVQLNKDGSFVRQFKPRAGEVVSFANLQDIFVDEIGGRLFVLDSNNLYIGKLTAE